MDGWMDELDGWMDDRSFDQETMCPSLDLERSLSW